mgnify:CR=1 FL=1
MIAPVDGGPARRLVSPFSNRWMGLPQWSADGRIVYHLSEERGRAANAIAVPVSGGAPHVVVRFDDPRDPGTGSGSGFGAAGIYLNLGDLQSDIWVAEVARH